jgi:hypothetical protein
MMFRPVVRTGTSCLRRQLLPVAQFRFNFSTGKPSGASNVRPKKDNTTKRADPPKKLGDPIEGMRRAREKELDRLAQLQEAKEREKAEKASRAAREARDEEEYKLLQKRKEPEVKAKHPADKAKMIAEAYPEHKNPIVRFLNKIRRDYPSLFACVIAAPLAYALYRLWGYLWGKEKRPQIDESEVITVSSGKIALRTPERPPTADWQGGINVLVELLEDRCSTDKKDLRMYTGEGIMNIGEKMLPAAIVWPKTTKEVGIILKVADAYNVPVVPYAGGTSIEGYFHLQCH